MTIIISAARASTLATAGTSNNPFVLWDNLGASGTWSTDVGTEVNSAAYAGTGTTYDQWSATPDANGDAAIEVDLGSAKTVSMVAIAAHNAGTIGASVSVQYSATGAGSWVTAGAATSPTDNQSICWYFEETSARYWRVLFDRGVTATSAAICGVMFVGEPLTMPQSIYQGYRPPLTPTEVALQSNVSEGGHLLGSSAVKRASIAQAELRHLADTFIRSYGADYYLTDESGATITDEDGDPIEVDPVTSQKWLAFQKHFNEGNGLFWAWRPTKYGDLHYAWRNGAPIAPDNSGPRAYMNARLEMRFYDEP